MDVNISVRYDFQGSFTISGVESVKEAMMLVEQNCGINTQEITHGTLKSKINIIWMNAHEITDETPARDDHWTSQLQSR